MSTNKNNISSLSKINLLDRVTSSIVSELGKVGLYHYNKLTYLFEFLFIKNFGTRYTGEKFCKLPHGPVITDYKRQISKLYEFNLIDVDLDELNRKRTVDDDFYISVQISKNVNTNSATLKNELVFSFLQSLLNKFSNLSVQELESVVYETQPIKKYQELVKRRFKKKIGGYVLDNNGIRLKDYTNHKTIGRKRALEHINKFPKVNEEQYKKFAEEFNYLKKLRPEWG